ITTINDSYPVFEHGVLIGAVELARDVTTLERVIYQPLKKYEEPITFASLTAVSASMKNIIARAEKAAAAKLPVLLVGESGT
ncbi:AAA family ATPase, partial [Tritonibacter sp. SIMBA_163]